MPWPSGDRDVTEWPEVSIQVEPNLREHLKDFTKIDGLEWNDYPAMDSATGHDRTPQRWRSYRKMYERLGLIRNREGNICLTQFGKGLSDLGSSISQERDRILESLALRGCRILLRYTLRNPIEDGSEFTSLPPDCDMRPYLAIWKSMSCLDGKLHYQELNRVLLDVMRMSDLDAAIQKIKNGRLVVGGNYIDKTTAQLDLILGPEVNGDQPSSRMAAWFSLAGWGGLIIERNNDASGFRNLAPAGKKLLASVLNEPLPIFRGTTKEEWCAYYVASESSALSSGNTNLLDEFHRNATAVEVSLVCKSEQMKRMFSAILSKRFLIFTGLAGSGKTKLAQAFAHWLTPDPGLVDPAVLAKGKNINPFYRLVSVGADWTSNENILGYPDGINEKKYVAKPALDLILHANDHSDIPHFLILDEMNLSHVERYFADILSLIESEEGMELYSGNMDNKGNWRLTSAGKKVPPKLIKLPENLFIIGTVNVDETTYMFSPKVLDRANVIEFRMDAKEIELFLANPAKPDLLKLDGKGASFGEAFVAAAKQEVAVPDDVKADYDAEMLLFFKMLQAHGAEFGYRTAYETARFIHFYKLLGNHADIPAGATRELTWFDKAFDCVVFQKLLPKLHGSRAKLGPVLKKLWFLCVNDAAGRGKDALKSAEEAARSTDKKAEPSVVVTDGALYPLSAEKIGRMWRLLIENGFASFAEA